MNPATNLWAWVMELLTPTRTRLFREVSEDRSGWGSDIAQRPVPLADKAVPPPSAERPRTKAASSESPDHAECARRIEREAKLAAYNGCTEAAAELYLIAKQERWRAGIRLRDTIAERRRERLGA